MASLPKVYCSLIIRASQFSSTTRNLVPRFRGGSKGEWIWLRHFDECHRSWLLFSKRSIHYVDVFISLLQVVMVKPWSFLQDLHRTYGKDKGEGLVTNIAGLLILACSPRRGQSNILMPSYFCFKSKWWSRHPFFGIFIVLTKRIWGEDSGRAGLTRLTIWYITQGMG